MKIAVSATGGSSNALVEPRFGRAPYFVIVDSDTMRFGVVANPDVHRASGAGPAAAALIANSEATVVLTGKVGPNARQALDAAGIEVVEDTAGTVREAVQAYQRTPRT